MISRDHMQRLISFYKLSKSECEVREVEKKRNLWALKLLYVSPILMIPILSRWIIYSRLCKFCLSPLRPASRLRNLLRQVHYDAINNFPGRLNDKDFTKLSSKSIVVVIFNLHDIKPSNDKRSNYTTFLDFFPIALIISFEGISIFHPIKVQSCEKFLQSLHSINSTSGTGSDV